MERLTNLPCLVGDEIYYITENRITRELEIADGKVSMVYQKADKTWHFRFSYRQQFTRTLLNPKFEWGTFQNECTELDFGKRIFTDKEQADTKLKELQNGK